MEKLDAETAMDEIEAQAPRSSSLFPVFLPSQPSATPNLTTSNDAVPEWLRNSSFTTDISVINDAVQMNYETIQFRQNLEDEDGDDIEKENQKGVRARYELLDSSASERGHSSSSGEDERGCKKKKRKKKRRKMQRSSDDRPPYGYALSSSSRKPWASSSSTANVKDYYFDSRGDPDNLTFGCIYRMDVPRYKLHESGKASEHKYYRRNDKITFGMDSDIDALDNELRSGGRYWSAMYSAIENHKNMKRLKVLVPLKPMISLPADFIPLSDEVVSDEGNKGGAISGNALVEESWEDEVFRKTKEFNKMTRERPHDAHSWLAFAQFQDKVASKQPQKGARLQTLEKKISILEKATELNPDSEDLLLSLMNAYQSRDSIDVLTSRWEKILIHNSGSFTLWREFLRVVQGEFSRFKVSEMRKMYANAIQALSGAWTKQHRQVSGGANLPSEDPAIVRLELGLVDIFLGLCRFEWQAGYRELATAFLQSQIEYSLFCPSLLLSEQSKQRLFEHFWNSDGARVGEDGALGWSKWLEKEEGLRQRAMREESLRESEKGGWTGWSEPLSKTQENNEVAENISETDGATDELEDGSEMKDDEQEDDTEALLKMLGIDAAVEADGEIKDTRTWTRWSEEEVTRESREWMPVRPKSGISQSKDPDNAQDDEQFLRVIAYEDVNDYLFSISSEEARISLVSQFIDFYGGRMSQWTCTNSSSWSEKSLSLEAMTDSLFDELRKMRDVLTKKGRNEIDTNLEKLFSSSDDLYLKTSMMRFVRNATLLCCSVFPQNHILEEAVLIAEELLNTAMNTSSCSVTPCRTLAKSLLKSNRQDVLLCGVYARREAIFGNIDHARKIFDMALSSIDGPPQDFRTNASLLYLWYAEVELAEGTHGYSGSPESFLHAMHILSCLGSGTKYSPYKCEPSSVQQLRARQGFKEQVHLLRSSWTRGIIDDNSVALLCSAALFEEITIGWTEGIEVLEQAFTMVLPERRRHSCHLERLFAFYVRMLCRHHQEMKLSKLWENIVKGLDMYPFSPNLYNALVEIGHQYTSPFKLRWIFDENIQKKSSLVAWLFALSFDMSRGGTEHRIRRLFERALENEKLSKSVLVWRSYIAYESDIACNPSAARRAFFRAIHACPWSKKLWLDGFIKLNSVLTVKELSDLHEVMRDKELNLRTDIYEILLQDEVES